MNQTAVYVSGMRQSPVWKISPDASKKV